MPDTSGWVKNLWTDPDDISMLWIHGYWVDGPADASHELMEYELGRRVKTGLLHHDLVLFDVFV